MEAIKEEVKQIGEKEIVGGFLLQFGGNNKNSSIQVENLSDPTFTINYNGSKRKVSLKELANLLDL